MRRFGIIVIGLALMVGLYLYDRDNRSQSVIATTVLSVEARSADVGEDTWHITVDVSGAPVTLETLHARPNLGTGDTLCVTRITRAGQPDVYRRANANDTC